MKLLLPLLIFASAATTAATATAETATGDAATKYPGYTLAFSEEFDTDGLPDTDRWRYEIGFVRNNEDQYYSDKNATVHDGVLDIEGRRERLKNPGYDPESNHWGKKREYAEYTSASLVSKGMYGYGIYEIRAKVPAYLGCWPAIWTWGEEYPWPFGGEIDIMEYYPVDGREGILANVAWGDAAQGKAVWNSKVIPLTDFDDNWRNEFHTWKMVWTPEKISLYIDDRLLNEQNVAETVNIPTRKDNADTNRDGKRRRRPSFDRENYSPFGTETNPQRIIVNLALGGDHGGSLADTPFPCHYLVDYIRYYAPENGNEAK